MRFLWGADTYGNSIGDDVDEAEIRGLDDLDGGKEAEAKEYGLEEEREEWKWLQNLTAIHSWLRLAVSLIFLFRRFLHKTWRFTAILTPFKHGNVSEPYFKHETLNYPVEINKFELIHLVFV